MGGKNMKKLFIKDCSILKEIAENEQYSIFDKLKWKNHLFTTKSLSNETRNKKNLQTRIKSFFAQRKDEDQTE